MAEYEDGRLCMMIERDKYIGDTLLCPICGEAYVHPVAVICNPAGSIKGACTVTHDGVHLDKTVGPEGRGVRIYLSFECEQGCRFVHKLYFHKGNTFIETERYDNMKPNEFSRVIWRD